MTEINLKAYAKINLSIDVLGKRSDGYHDVSMVMAQIDLWDQIRVEWQENPDEKSVEIELATNLPYLPTDNRNLAYMAAVLMADTYKKEEAGQIKINIYKKIPIAAGLAGGSANAAAVLHALNKIWGLGLNVERLMELGVQLGADVPFCIAGQASLNKELGLQDDYKAGTCAIATGIGEKLEIVPPVQAWILLSKPPISVSTAQVYKGLNLSEIKSRPDTMKLVEGIREKNYYKISKNMINILENYSLKEYPIVMYTKNKIIKEGKPYMALMSGSGPTVFGLYLSKMKAKIAYTKLKDLNKETFLVKTL